MSAKRASRSNTVTASWKCLLCVLALILTSCASLPKEPPAYLPPKIDCAAYDAPKVKPPTEPALTEKNVLLWQLYAWGWQAYAESVVGQRYDTALCLEGLRRQGVTR